MSRRALILNSASGTVLLVVTLVTSFIMSPFLVHQLGNASYGFWELVLGLVGYLGILDVGVGPAVLRYVAVANGSGDRVALSKVVNAGLASFLLAGVVGSLVLLLTTVRPALLFGDVPIDLADARIAISLGALIFLLSFCRATFSASLMGLQLHRVVNLVRTVSCVVTALIVRHTLPLWQTHALTALASLVALSTLVELSIFAVCLLRQVDRSLINPLLATWADVRELLGFGVKSAGLMASGSLMRQGLLFVISHVVGVVGVTYYAIASRLIDYSQQLTGSIGFPLAAYFSSTLGSHGMDGARQAWLSTTRVIQFIQAGIAMGVVWLGVPFLSLWMGAEYAQRGAPVFYFLCGGLFMQVLACNANKMLVSLNQHGRAATAALVFAVVCMLFAVIACIRFGLTGAAAAAALYMTGLGFIELGLLSRTFGISAIGHVVGTIRRYAVPVLSGTLMLAWLAWAWPATSYIRIIAHAAIAGIPYVVFAWFSALSRDERARLITAMSVRASRSVKAVAASTRPGTPPPVS